MQRVIDTVLWVRLRILDQACPLPCPTEYQEHWPMYSAGTISFPLPSPKVLGNQNCKGLRLSSGTNRLHAVRRRYQSVTYLGKGTQADYRVIWQRWVHTTWRHVKIMFLWDQFNSFLKERRPFLFFWSQWLQKSFRVHS